MSEQVVLVVDDYEDNRQILSVLLQHGGYRVLTADDVPEGLRLAELHRPDLILLDLMMPGLDGWAAIKELRGNRLTKTIPVVAVTAKDEHGLLEQLRTAGFCAYLKKPFLPNEALDAVHRCLVGSDAKQSWIDLPNYRDLRPPRF